MADRPVPDEGSNKSFVALEAGSFRDPTGPGLAGATPPARYVVEWQLTDAAAQALRGGGAG